MLLSYPVSLLLSSLALLPRSSLARITGFTTPTATLHPGQKFNVTFITSNYITNNLQYYALFGLARGAEAIDGALGPTPLGGNGLDLVTSGHSSQGTGAFNVSLQIPKPFNTLSGGTETYTVMAVVLGTVSTPGGLFSC